LILKGDKKGNLAWLISGGFAKGYRTQVLGVTTALSAVALWAVGDMSLANLLGNQACKGKITPQGLARSCRIQALCLKVPPNMHYGAERCGR